jgi:hypothetical protein
MAWELHNDDVFAQAMEEKVWVEARAMSIQQQQHWRALLLLQPALYSPLV